MIKYLVYICLLLIFLFSTLLQASKIDEFQFQSLVDNTSAHNSSSTSSVCSRASTNGSKNGASSTRLEVVHRDGPCAQEGSKRQKALTLSEILAMDQLRVQSIQAAVVANTNNNEDLVAAAGDGPTQLPAHKGTSLGTGNYVVTISLGTPKHKLTLMFDTGSDLTWTQCQPCPPRECYKQNEPLFNPHASSTYRTIPCTSPYCTQLGNHKRGGPGCLHRNPDCTYQVYYGGGAFTTGFYSKDRLTVSIGDVFRGFRFGCGNDNFVFGEFAGILGLGRGPLSFVDQTEYKYKGVFSYCLPVDSSKTGFISFGGGDDYYKNIHDMSFTPLVHGPSDHYHIEITGISVGGNKLPIKGSVFTTAGAIIDSGTVITRLPPDAYNEMKNEFKKQMNARHHKSAPPEHERLDTCFYMTEYNKDIPEVSFTFKGGARIKFGVHGKLYYVDSGKACLAFAGNKKPTDLAIFGNTQQTQLEVLYDVHKNQLGFRNNEGCH